MFRISSGGAELGVDVRGLLGIILVVAEAEEVEVDGCAGSAELEGVHGVAAFAVVPPPTPDFQRRKEGDLRGETVAAERRKEEES